MANLRQLSVFSLSLAVLAGSSFPAISDNPPEPLKNPPPDKTVFFEADLWQHNANKEWTFTHLLLSAIRAPDAAKIDKLQVTEDTKNSLHAIRHEFLNPATQSKVETASMPDLVYAYSWSNAGFASYMFSGLQAIKNKVMDADDYVTDNVSFYKEHKAKVLGTSGAIIGTSTAIYGVKNLCAPPAANPAKGWFLKRHIMNAVKNIANGAQNAWAGITGHPYVAAAVAGTYVAYESCMTAGNMYYDVPLALQYYTDRIAGGDGSAQAGTYTNTFYGFSRQSAGDHFRWYIDMNTYNTMLRGFLTHGKRLNQLQFGAVPARAESLLDRVSNYRYLTEIVHTPYLPDYFDRLGSDYATARTKHREEVEKVVKQTVNLNDSASDCRKYVLFNDALFDGNSDPLYLFSLCSVGDTFAYAKLPWLPYARMKKTEAVGFVQDLMEYTGSTRLVVMSEKKS